MWRMLSTSLCTDIRRNPPCSSEVMRLPLQGETVGRAKSISTEPLFVGCLLIAGPSSVGSFPVLHVWTISVSVLWQFCHIFGRHVFLRWSVPTSEKQAVRLIQWFARLHFSRQSSFRFLGWFANWIAGIYSRPLPILIFKYDSEYDIGTWVWCLGRPGNLQIK